MYRFLAVPATMSPCVFLQVHRPTVFIPLPPFLFSYTRFFNLDSLKSEM